MTQTLLLSKLARFLKLKNAKAGSQFQKITGLCFGLSICHAAMKQVGKLDWWEGVLSAILHWNGDISQLKNIVKLPNTSEPQTLQQLCEKVLNYVVYYQQGVEFVIDDIDKLFAHQITVLVPKSAVFEMMTPEGEIKTIQTREFIVGKFKRKELNILINKHDVANSIYLINNYEHAITIGYQKPYWIWYDPNDNHLISGKQKIHKRFKSKSKLLNKILYELDDHLSIEKASFDIDPLKTMTATYEAMILANSDIVLSALPLVARDTPQCISQVMVTAKKNMPTAILAEKLAEIIATCYQIDENWTGLHYLARYAPSSLPSILDLVLHAEEGIKKLALALAEKNSKGVTGLQMIVQHAPQSLGTIFTSLCADKKSDKWLHKVLYMQHKHQKTKLLAAIKQYVPESTFNAISAITINERKETHKDKIKNVQEKSLGAYSLFNNKVKINSDMQVVMQRTNVKK